MKISKLVSLAAVLLTLAWAGSGSAAEEAPMAAPEAGEGVAAAAPAPAEAPVAEAEASPESPAVSGSEADAAAMPEAAAAAAEPSEAASAPETNAEPALAETSRELGAVGHDAQGRPGRVHIVVRGDTLWDVSNAYLGTPWVWPSIWKDNQEIHNPHLIRPGDHIWITPSEMRRVSPEEAAALLAGQPAALEPDAVAATEPEPEAEPPQLAAPAPAPQNTLYVTAREGVGLVTPEALEAAGSIVSSNINKVMLSQGDAIFVGVPEGDTQKGDQYTIFRVQEKVFDPETGRVLGHHVDILGWVEIEQPHPESALATIRESFGEIEVGDRLMPRNPLPAEVAILDGPGDVDGMISFFANKRTLMGTQDFVYLNRGALQGLEVGSPLVVYRPSFLAEETTRNEDVRVPERVIAQLLVVRANPDTAVAYVAGTNTELALGDHFRGAQ